ncbi:MAG: phage portal protein [Rhodobacteraceae bacterium]|nr:phage portal protein [Paracoccaceae bacterium]
MGLFGFTKKQKRSSFNRDNIPASASNFLERMGWSDGLTTGVTVDSALGVPAIWAAVQFLSGTIAGLPLRVFEKAEGGAIKVTGGIGAVLGGAVSDEMTSFDWRKYGFEQVFTGGRFISYIERNRRGEIVNIFPINPAAVIVKRIGSRKVYEVKQADRTKITYAAKEVIDIPFMLRSDGIKHRSPIFTHKRAVSQAIEAAKYGAKAFANGGVPPLVATGPFVSGVGAQRASDDIAKAMHEANTDGRNILTMPTGHDLKAIGFSAKDIQMIESQRFSIEEVARIYSLPPIFLQDLTNGTFSNSEQQDLHLVKHTIRRWVEQTEQELNLKLFGRDADFYVKFNVDALLRGDFASRMDGMGKAIQNGLLTPNEGRALDERPALDGGNNLMIQGATVPLNAGKDGVSAVDIEDYGRSVRAGTVTPQIEDEQAIRVLMGLPEMSDAARELWEAQGLVRQPITLQSGEEAEALADNADDETPTEGENDNDET